MITIDTEEMKPVTEAYFNIAADEFYYVLTPYATP